MLRASATAEFSAFAEALDQQLGFGRDRACQAAPLFYAGRGESSVEKHSRMLHKEGRVPEQCPPILDRE